MITGCRATTIFFQILLFSTIIDYFSEIASWGILMCKLWGYFGVYCWFGLFGLLEY
jgi:hypothetical protein